MPQCALPFPCLRALQCCYSRLFTSCREWLLSTRSGVTSGSFPVAKLGLLLRIASRAFLELLPVRRALDLPVATPQQVRKTPRSSLEEEALEACHEGGTPGHGIGDTGRLSFRFFAAPRQGARSQFPFTTRHIRYVHRLRILAVHTSAR